MADETTSVAGIGMAAISFAVAILAIVVISLILTNIKDMSIVTDELATVSNNDTLTWAGNNTKMSLTQNRISTSSLVLYNNGTVVNQGANPGNYTVASDGITITNVSGEGAGFDGMGDGINTALLNVSYDYFLGSGARNATEQGLAAQNSFASFMPMAAMAIVGALVIGIVLAFFRMRRDD